MRILWYFHLFLFFFFFLLLPPPFFSFGVLVPFFFLTGNFLEDFLFILCSRTYSNVIAVCLILSCSSYDVSLLRRFVIMRSPPLYVCYSECSSTNVTAGSFMLILFCPWRNLSFFRDKIVLLIPTHFGYSCCKLLFWSINSVLVSLLLFHALWVRCRVQYFSVYIFQTAVLVLPLFLHFSGVTIMV